MLSWDSGKSGCFFLLDYYELPIFSISRYNIKSHKSLMYIQSNSHVHLKKIYRFNKLFHFKSRSMIIILYVRIYMAINVKV